MLKEVKALVAAAAVLAVLVAPGAARADFSGDGPGDVLTVHPDGRLLQYRGNGAGGWAPNVPDAIGSGWGGFTAFLAPGDFSGDGKPDILVRDGDGHLLMYRGNGAGGFAGARQTVGSGWGPFTALLAPGDFSGDGKPDVLARDSAGALLMYRGDGDGGWLTGTAEKIGSGWAPFTSILGGGDFSGDGKPDVLAVNPDGALLHVPRQRRRRLGHRHRRAGRLGLGRRSPRSPRAATSPATARPTCSPASPTARCCSIAATAPAAGSPASASRSAAAGTG